ncbi:MAG: HEAT repeat domain-containing protein [Nostoc sp. DedSLP03]|uniref:HEAT repeat domain-containing protein n=1 Tax=Nostoc sp. DedSLP03 TaxID=3075400 RepID=UPI002AD3FF1A|nr:HEAT repeat domain-containing protein [Nostoc sp. DedSLP03]MDZ7965475.1 HEAT repeat domain-containing protein [Nostoc sp. DedSLP03]
MIVEWFTLWIGQKTVGFLVKTIISEEFLKDLVKDYAKDFFKNIFNNAVTAPFKQEALKQEALKQEPFQKAVIMALTEFLQLMQQQLKVRCKLSEAEIQNYTEDIKMFIRDKSVKEILGQAFDIKCDSLDFKTFADSWKRLQLKPLPPKFNWQTITDQYLIQVQDILSDSEELRYILELQKLSSIDKILKENADITKDFNLLQYLEAIRERYGNLKLDSLETTSREHPVNLWQMFIPQNVRQVYQVLPELPKEHLRRLQESNQLDTEFEIEKFQEETERYQRTYFEQPIRSVLDVIREKQRKNYLVILGDPGSGKSTLLQYLALDWVEKTLEQNDFNLPIPLLIELRNYMRDRDTGSCNNFLQFYHNSPNCFYHLNQHKLHEQLKAGNALVMFDGLDEIFEPTKREEVITSIHRFTNEYPDVQVIVTSRIIGYKQQQLRDAEFRHFMLQDLESAQIKDFIQRWHDKTFSQAEERDKNIKQERLQRVINESKAIAELAQNPLLLTMMAILNLKRELPRDRSELYKDASEVLLHNWDDGRNLKPDERLDIIDYKDKQAMLRQVAYLMQTSEKGLAGNFIYADDLEAIFTKYLQSIPVSDARDKARRLMKQLRDRNFILCFLGADYYAFVHRTFLEYFCAWEFVWQFEKERSITIEFLKTEVFGKHWQDETWHEVLRLIAGMIEPKFVGEIIDYLMVQDGEEQKFINLFLAAKCLAEVRNRLVIASVANKLLNELKDLTKYDLWYYYELYDDEEETELVQEIRTQAVATVAAIWKDNSDTLHWLKDRATADDDENVRRAAIEALASNFPDDLDTRSFLKDRATADDDENVRRAAIEALASNFKDDPDTWLFIKDCATADDDENVRRAAIEALASNFEDDPDTRSFIKDCATADIAWDVRYAAIEALASNFKDDPDTCSILKDRATADHDWDVQRAAIEALASNFKDDLDTRSFLKDLTTADDEMNVRCAAIEALASNFKDDLDTCSFLKDRATADHENVRGAAIKALASNFKDDPDARLFIKDCAIADDDKNVRCAAIEALASNFKDDLDTCSFLKDRATADHENVRGAAIKALASNFKDDPDTCSILKDRATADNQWNVRSVAIEALASNFKDDPDTCSILKDLTIADNAWNLRRAAIEALASNFKDDPDTRSILKDRAIADNEGNVRRAAIEALASNFKDDPDTRSILKDRATADNEVNVRRAAIEALAKYFRNQPELFEIYYDCAVNDPFERNKYYETNPRRIALEIIIKQFPQYSQTLPLLRDKAENDPDEEVREFVQQKLAELEK